MSASVAEMEPQLSSIRFQIVDYTQSATSQCLLVAINCCYRLLNSLATFVKLI